MNTSDSRLDEPGDKQREQSRGVFLVRDDGTHQLIGEVIAGPGSTWTAFGVASDCRKTNLGSFPTRAAAEDKVFDANPLPKEMVEHQRERDSRKQAIAKFDEEQQKTPQWIRLQSIADHCSETADPTLPPDKKEDLKVNALISLLDSALNGKFEVNRKSRLLRVHHDYEIEPAWLIDPNSAPPEAFISPQDLRDMLIPDAIHPGVPERERKKLTSKGKVARYIIANCWIPKELAVRWLESCRPPVAVPTLWSQDTSHPQHEYRTGVAGRPTSKQLVENELDRWVQGNIIDQEVKRWAPQNPELNLSSVATALCCWLHHTHKGAPQPKVKTVLNALRGKLRSAVASAQN